MKRILNNKEYLLLLAIPIVICIICIGVFYSMYSKSYMSISKPYAPFLKVGELSDSPYKLKAKYAKEDRMTIMLFYGNCENCKMAKSYAVPEFKEAVEKNEEIGYAAINVRSKVGQLFRKSYEIKVIPTILVTYKNEILASYSGIEKEKMDLIMNGFDPLTEEKIVKPTE